MCDVKEILKSAKKIAIVGLSPDTTKDSNQVGKYLQKQGFDIIPIYPKEEMILGKKVYRNVQDALQNEGPDILVIFRKSEACKQIALEVLDAKVLPKIFWMQLGITNSEVKVLLESKRIAVVENQCIKIEHQKLGG